MRKRVVFDDVPPETTTTFTQGERYELLMADFKKVANLASFNDKTFKDLRLKITKLVSAPDAYHKGTRVQTQNMNFVPNPQIPKNNNVARKKSVLQKEKNTFKNRKASDTTNTQPSQGDAV